MKKTVLLFSISLLLFACSSTKKASSDAATSNTEVRDGSSFEKAIIITEKTETAGVAAEYDWLNVHYPNYKMGSQALDMYKQKPFDILKITTEKGQKISVYFDISNYFGKF